MAVAVRKICCICHRDVRKQRRTKDRRGNYFCYPCYESRLRAYKQKLKELSEQSAAGVTLPMGNETFVAPERGSAESVITADSPSNPPPPRSHSSWTRLEWTLPFVVGAMVGLCFNRSPHTMLAAVLGLIACAAVAILMLARGPRPRRRVRAEASMASPPPPTAVSGIKPAPAAAPPESAAENLQPHEVTQTVVEVRRRVRRRRPRSQVRVSDLLSEEAQAECEAAEGNPDPAREPEIPASPAVNPPIKSILDEFAPLLVRPAPAARGMRLKNPDNPFDSSPFRLA